MRLLDVGQTAVRLAPETVLALAAALLLLPLPTTALALTALVLHESAHVLTAHRLGFAVEELHLLPFGAAMRLRHPAGDAGSSLIALAGPLCNLVAAGACAAARMLFSSEHVKLFLWMNLGMGTLNLLPILPLDGGRLLRELLERRLQPQTVRIATHALSLTLSVGLLGAAVWLYAMEQIPPTGFLFPIGVLLLALRHLLCERRSGVAAVLAHRAHLRDGHSMEVLPIAMRETEKLSAAASLLRNGRYLLIVVLDNRGERIGTIGEELLLEALGRYGRDAPIRKAVNLEK